MEGVRFRLVNSLATQPNGGRAGAWQTVPLAALAREEQRLAAKHALSGGHGGGGGTKAGVPLHGELRGRNAAATRAAARRLKVTRDVGLVRDLVW